MSEIISLVSAIELSDSFKTHYFSIFEVWPEHGIKRDGKLSAFNPIDNYDGREIQLTNRTLGIFVILVLRENKEAGDISATIVDCVEGKTLEETFKSYYSQRLTTKVNANLPEPGRIMRPLLDGQHSVSLAIIVQMWGRKTTVILMDLVPCPHMIYRL